jgi:hypothetical protein
MKSEAALKDMENGKSPGIDNIPLESNRQHGD